MKLSEKKIREWDEKLRIWSNSCGTENEAIYQAAQVHVRLSFPLGELLNLGGYVWAWAWRNKIKTGPIEKSDRFSAQGLEGKASVEVTLATAIMAVRDIPAHRYQIETIT